MTKSMFTDETNWANPIYNFSYVGSDLRRNDREGVRPFVSKLSFMPSKLRRAGCAFLSKYHPIVRAAAQLRGNGDALITAFAAH